MQCNRQTIRPTTRSRWARKRSLTSAWRRSTSSTRKQRLLRRTATFSSPVVAAVVDVVVVAVAVVVAAVVDAVAAAAAVAASALAAAVLPGALAAGAKRSIPLSLINDYCHGRVRHRRPGLCMCPCSVICQCASPVSFAAAWAPRHITITPNSNLNRRNIRTPIGFQGISQSGRTCICKPV